MTPDPTYEAESLHTPESRERDARLAGHNRTCRKCGGGMKPSKALTRTFRSSPYMGQDIVTITPGGPGKLTDCIKCEGCGWSITI